MCVCICVCVCACVSCVADVSNIYYDKIFTTTYPFRKKKIMVNKG